MRPNSREFPQPGRCTPKELALDNNPVEIYKRHFRTTLARDEITRERVYRVRYEVYCREFGFESEVDCPQQMERDEYESRSQHCLLVHRDSGLAAGCVRLVQTDPADPTAPLPFEKHCRDALDRDRFDPQAVQRHEVAEFSRLAVTSRFRRRRGDGPQFLSLAPAPDRDDRRRNAFPVIPVSLFVSALSLLLASRARYGIAMMEPRLARMLQRHGVLFEPIGRVMDYHGPRGPFMIRRETIMDHMAPSLVAMMAVIRGELFSADGRALRQRRRQRLGSVFSESTSGPPGVRAPASSRRNRG